jgi:transposase
MDTSVVAVTTDKLGRPNGPRRKYTIAEKRAMVEETQRRGASVAMVAQRHGVNANLVFGWRKLYQRGLLVAEAPLDAPALLPVKVSTPTLMPSERATAAKGAHKEAGSGSIEIEFAGGQRLRIRGRVDRSTLARVIDVLLRR